MIADPADRSSTLRAQIGRYVHHNYPCSAGVGQACTCGLEQVLALFEQPRQETREKEKDSRVLPSAKPVPVAHVERSATDAPVTDAVCEHGTALDVHCCNCHGGFLFDSNSCVCVFEPESADWGAFLRERHLLILEWTAEGQSPEQIEHALSMDPMQVQLIAMTAEESTRPHRRRR